MAEDADLFSVSEEQTKKASGYTAQDIEVLEGLEPVRKRPGMYIGGTDERAPPAHAPCRGSGSCNT